MEEFKEFSSKLRSVYSGVKMSHGFEDRLWAEMASETSVAHRFRQSLFMRLAASLLILCVVGVPAAAFMGVFGNMDKVKPTLTYTPVYQPDEEMVAEAFPDIDDLVIPPEDGFLVDDLSQKKISVLKAQNYWRYMLSSYPKNIREPLLEKIDLFWSHMAMLL